MIMRYSKGSTIILTRAYQFNGSFEKLVPDAKLDDGYYTLIIVEKANLAELGHIMTLASRGEHTKHPKVIYKKQNQLIFHHLQICN